MEDIYSEPTGPQFYIVSQEGYDDLRNIQTKLVVMAQVAHSDEDIESVNLRRMLNRSDINRFFAEISVQIGNALDGIRKDNLIAPPNHARQ